MTLMKDLLEQQRNSELQFDPDEGPAGGNPNGLMAHHTHYTVHCEYPCCPQPGCPLSRRKKEEEEKKAELGFWLVINYTALTDILTVMFSA